MVTFNLLYRDLFHDGILSICCYLAHQCGLYSYLPSLLPTTAFALLLFSSIAITSFKSSTKSVPGCVEH